MIHYISSAFLLLFLILFFNTIVLAQKHHNPINEALLIGKWKSHTGYMNFKEPGRSELNGFHIDTLVFYSDNTYMTLHQAEYYTELSRETGKWRMDPQSNAITFFESLISNTKSKKYPLTTKLHNENYQLLLKKASKNKLIFGGITTYAKESGETGVTSIQVTYKRLKKGKT